METSTSGSSDVTSGAALVASASVADRKEFLRSLSGDHLRALPYLFDFWALDHQLAPKGDWRTWVILGGRGAGKTRAGAEWVRSMVEGPRPRDGGVAKRFGLIGETMEQAREVMVFGESGILACSPPDRKPVWISGRKMLVWPSGAEARLYSAFDPERLRGPQFDAVWADELAKWPRAQETWDMMQFGLRLGKKPRACVTTTPRNVAILKDVLGRDSTVQTHAATDANRAYLADSFLAEVQERYAGTRLGRQELDGMLLSDVDGALWNSVGLERSRVVKLPEMDRIVVAVDPPAGANATSDACGIIVAGIVSQGPVADWKIFVLEDASVQGVSPNEWAAAAIAAMDRHSADRMVAEVNQGGAMVEAIVRSIDPAVSYRAVHATRGKAMRAEPVAALYEQGRVHHMAGLGDLEDEMCQMTAQGYAGQGSPDRVDALVWALTDLFLEPAKRWRAPQVRTL
ncbi:terminase family protein [Octadecabacter sp.]|nr:terminase family protein [Octadecabacter sp.]